MPPIGLSDLSVGDVDVPHLDVTPAATDTVGVLTVHRPDGTHSTLTVTAGPLGADPGSGQPTRRLTGTAVTYTLPGRWVLSWQVSGTGVGVEDVEVWVTPAPVPGGPTWTPGLSRVAQYIPRLTVDTVTPGSAAELGTFNAYTNPDDVKAQHHIDDAVAGVLAILPVVPAGLEPLARTVAALRAAASLQRSYSNTSNGLDTLQIAAALDARADADLARLRTAIDDLADGDGDGFFDIAPIYSSPAAPPWGTRYL